MIARYSGATLGLLAFTITISAGLLAQNPVEVTLSRSILALLVFCGIGFILGGAAQIVIAEHEESCQEKIRQRYHGDSVGTEDGGPQEGAGEGEGESVAT